MKKKLIALALLAAATGALTVSCGPDVDPSDGDSSVVETWATRVKITKLGTLIVGESFKLSDIVETTPAGAKYTVEGKSGKDTVYSIGADNNTITIIGSGTGAIQLKGQTGNILGEVNITAMSEAGKALQEWCDGLSNNYLLDATWNEIEGVWADATDATQYAESEGMGLMVTDKYVVDGTYEAYSAVALEKADGAAYGFTLLDGSGVEVNYAGGFKAALDGAASFELGDRADAAYIDRYFVMDGLLNVLDYTEGDDGWFTLTDGTTSQDLVGSLFGMNVTNYTGVSAKVKLVDDVLQGTVKFDAKATVGCAIDFKLYQGVSLPILESAVVDQEPPAKLDVTDLASHYGQFINNYQVDWECGVFTPGLQTYSTDNTVGVTFYTENAIVAAACGLTEEGALDTASAQVFGYYGDSTGLYEVSLDDETSTIVKGDTALSTQYTSPYVVMPSASELFTAEVLDDASLSLAYEDADSGMKQYSYNGSFDTAALGLLIEEVSPFGYKFYSYGEDIVKYGPEGVILDLGSKILHSFTLNYDGTNGIGYVQQFSNAGNVENPIGKKAWEAFPNYFADPSASTSSGESSSEA